MTPAVVLAAGTSSRYAGGNKLLADFQGLPLLVRTIALLLPAARPIVVVTGHDAARVRRCIRATFGQSGDIRLIHNSDYRDGMGGSLRLGVGALPPMAPRAFLCLADMPGVDARLLRRLKCAWRANLDIIRPVFQGRPGHPVLISRRLFPAFEALTGDQGARTIIAAVPEHRQQCVPWHAGCVLDTDTPAAMRVARLRFRHIHASFNRINGNTMRLRDGDDR